jgi:hypothetical protein
MLALIFLCAGAGLSGCAAEDELPDQAIELETGQVVDSKLTTKTVSQCPGPPWEPADYICFYDTASGSYMEAYPDILPYHRCYNLSAANNRTSFIVNWTAAGWYVYDASNCRGSPGYIYPNSSGPMNATWSNKISSIMRLAIP